MNQYNTVFLYGPGHTGKTTCAATFPSPILHIMFDIGGKELPFLGPGYGTPVEHTIGSLPVVDVIDKTGNLRSRTEIWSAYPDLEKNPHKIIERLQEPESQYKTLVFDSTTTFSKFLLYASREFINKDWTHGKTVLKHYGLVSEYVGMLMFNLFPRWNCNRVMISHLRSVDVETNARTEGIGDSMVRVPNLPGQLRGEYTTQFTEVWRAWVQFTNTVNPKTNTPEITRKYLMQTQPSGQFHAHTSINARDNHSNIWKEIVKC